MSSVASFSSSALTPQTSLESVISSNSSAHEEMAASHWSRLRHRLHDVGSRRKRENNSANPITRPKLGSLVKLATKERKHQSARRMGSLNTQLNQDGVTALWCEINKLEQRVEELETALDNSQVHIVCMEKKYEHIQLQVQTLLSQQKVNVRALGGSRASVDSSDLRSMMSRCLEKIRNREYSLNHIPSSC